ncbi:MAG TPA: serine/threonine-protein kinase [Gemmataceae bacterium]|nr:serine/threonine-protein kinase [Gemmataceae bacterium]
MLGAGGMGVVFQAEDPQLQRLVALKAMLPGLAASDTAKQRFLREARAAAALKHDHIVTIYQVGEDRDVPFLAMEFLEGEALDDRLKRVGKLPVAEVLRIGRETALGLAAVHNRDLIHRDIKPANIWLESVVRSPWSVAKEKQDSATDSGPRTTDYRAKILDFGLARTSSDDAHLTQTGAVVGTPSYMAPEQAQGNNIGPPCDLFSLGCVLYRMATGELPFKGRDMVSTLIAVATEDPRPPHELQSGLPPALSKLIMDLLAKEPGERPASAQAVVETLEHIAPGCGASPSCGVGRRHCVTRWLSVMDRRQQDCAL